MEVFAIVAKPSIVAKLMDCVKVQPVGTFATNFNSPAPELASSALNTIDTKEV
jgi:hypothetical protein